MWRAWGLLSVALLTPVLLILVTLKQREAEGRQWTAEQQMREIAALRPPALPPRCPAYLSIDGLRLPAKDFANVRVFRFGGTVYYVPNRWLRIKPPSLTNSIGGIERDALGAFDPDLHVDECPGIVHEVTNAGLYFTRFMGVGFSPEPDSLNNDALRPLRDVTYIYAQKLRHEGNNIREAGVLSYLEDGFQASFNHQRLDADVLPVF